MENIKDNFIIADNSNMNDKLYDSAVKLYENGEYQKAQKIFADLLLYMTDSNLYLQIGNCYLKLGKPLLALEYWNKAFEIDPNNTKAYINIGNLYYSKQNFDKAIYYWTMVLVHRPEDLTANLNLAVAYNGKNMRIKSIQHYEKYLKYSEDKATTKYLEIRQYIDKNHSRASDQVKLANQCERSRDRINAARAYSKSIFYYPLISQAYTNLGLLYFEDCAYDSAINYWLKAYELDSNSQELILNLALAYDLKSQFDYALCYYTRYLYYIFNNKLEYDKIYGRCMKIKKYIDANSFLVEKHLVKAKEAYAASDYFTASVEYKNYVMLKPSENETYDKMITTLYSFLYPEQKVVAKCLQTGNALFAKRDYKLARAEYERITRLAKQNSVEFINAKAKINTCLKNENEKNNFNTKLP